MSAPDTRNEIKVSESAIPTDSGASGFVVDNGIVATEVTAQAKATSQESDKTTQSRTCGVCNDHESKYKCTRCALPYCSVACATLHRATHPAVSDDIPPATSEAIPPVISNGMLAKPTQGAVASITSHNAFTVLEGSKELQTLFMMYPRLRSQLRDIYVATLPPAQDSSSMSGHYYEEHQQFQRGRGRGRGRTGRGKDRGPWNVDRGTQDGIDALCYAKGQYGKGGEGIGEYVELVLKFVAAEGIDITKLVQEEVAEENAKIIAQLLNGDSY